MKPLPKDSSENDIELSEKNGFKKTHALPITRLFQMRNNFIANHGETVKSLEGEQKVKNCYAVMFDDYDKLLGYPVDVKSFNKYKVTKESTPTTPGIATKNDNTIFLSKKMDETFSAVIWNDTTLQGKKGDYLVTIPDTDDYRVIDSDVFKKSYKQV